MNDLYWLKRLRRSALALHRRRSETPVNVRKLYAAEARMWRAVKAFRAFAVRAANPNNLPACGYCGYTTHEDTPCPSRTMDASRFNQPDRKPNTPKP